MLIVVILAWLCVVGYIPFHFRKCEPVHDFFAGFAVAWKSLLQASDFVSDHELSKGYADSPFQSGARVALISMVVAAVLIIAFAGYTIYLAC